MGAIPSALWADFFEGSRLACARLVTLVENDQRLVAEVRDRLAERIGKAVRIGITGPPGVGKSTLTSSLAAGLSQADHRVGVIAVDPSSPFTGGSFMGDRVRMEALVGNPNVYVRSLASRKGQGGLSPATPHVADVIEGFGMDRILIETVGVGQAELDVLACADLVILVMQPSTGDAIQSLKAGILEAADIVVVNKADLPGTDSVIQSLKFAFSLTHKGSPPILPVSALQNTGIEELLAEVAKQSQDLVESGRHRQMRAKRVAAEIRSALQDHLWSKYLEASNSDAFISESAENIAASGGSPFPLIRELTSRIIVEVQTEER